MMGNLRIGRPLLIRIIYQMVLVLVDWVGLSWRWLIKLIGLIKLD